MANEGGGSGKLWPITSALLGINFGAIIAENVKGNIDDETAAMLIAVLIAGFIIGLLLSLPAEKP